MIAKLPRTAHPTKKGPGRRHGQGVPHGRAPEALKGAASGFEVRGNNARNSERQLKRQLGARQLRIQIKLRRQAEGGQP